MQAPLPPPILRNRYRVLRPLGRGGFGQTYIAEDLDLPGSPRCVVKQLKPASHDPFFLENARRLFQTEAQTLLRVGNHDQIPRLLANFEENEQFYLVQELVEGHTISEELLPGQRWSDLDIEQFLEDGLGILQFVHRQGVIHRDVKPDNLLRRHHDRKLVLVDFGTVKEIRTPGLTRRSQGSSMATIAVGTPGYMPTEQGRGKPRPNSDIYALGVIAVQAATGLSPDQFQEDLETGEIIWQPWAQVNQRLANILSQMVRYYFRDRYQTTEQVLADLASLLGKAPPAIEETFPEPANTLVLPPIEVPTPPAIATLISPPPETDLAEVAALTEPQTVTESPIDFADAAAPIELQTVEVVDLVEPQTVSRSFDSDKLKPVSQAATLTPSESDSIAIVVSTIQRSVKIAALGMAGIAIAGVFYLTKPKPSAVSIPVVSPAPQQTEAEQNQAVLSSAIELAKDGKDSSLEQAIGKAKEIPSSSSIYTKAQTQAYAWQSKILQKYLQIEAPKKYPGAEILASIKPEIKKLDANEIVIEYDSSRNSKFAEPEGIKLFAAILTELLRGNQKEISRVYAGFNQLTAYPIQGDQQATLSAKDWDAHVEAREADSLIREKAQLRDR